MPTCSGTVCKRASQIDHDFGLRGAERWPRVLVHLGILDDLRVTGAPDGQFHLSWYQQLRVRCRPTHHSKEIEERQLSADAPEPWQFGRLHATDSNIDSALPWDNWEGSNAKASAVSDGMLAQSRKRLQPLLFQNAAVAAPSPDVVGNFFVIG